MRKKRQLQAFLLSFALISTSYAGDFLIEGKAAYFYPTNDRFKEIYSGGGIYGLELSFQIHNELFFFLSGDYFSKSGRSVLYDGNQQLKGNRTHIRLAPAGFGVKYIKQFNRIVDFYASLGALATYLNIENYLQNETTQHIKWGPGVSGKIGSLITINEALFADLAIDYRYIKIHFNDPSCCTRDFSGFSFGGGLGYRF